MKANTYTIEQIKEMADALRVVYKHDPASTTLTASTLQGVFHGNTAQYGLFSTPGVRPQRYSALARPWSLANIIGLERSEFWVEKLEIMTGQLAASGENATGWCGNPPVVGNLKTCKQNFNWGKYLVKTNLNALPMIGTLRDRADVPGEILNAGPTGNPFIPDVMYRLDNTMSQLQHELFKIGVEVERTLDQMIILGNNGTATAPFGWWADFDGLDRQIKTGYTDADTGIACAAMDSAVLTYSANVNTTTADGRNIVQAVEDTAYGLQQRASKVGMDGAQWVIVMREELFRALVEQYACKYYLYACAGGQYDEINTNARDANDLRIQMLNGRYLYIAGIPWPVVFSEGVPQTTPLANTFESDMYFVPISWGGQKLLRMQYFPMDNQWSQEFANFGGAETAVLNNGLWISAKRSTGLCVEYHFGAQMRLILEAPFLAGRIDNLQYTFAAPIKNALPGASFYSDGGVSYRS